MAQNALRITKALQGQRSPSGRIYEIPLEIMATFGLRVTKFDPKIALNFRVQDFKEELSNANSYLYEVAGDINPRDQSELTSAFETANDIRLRAYEKFQKLVEAAKKSGLSDQSIRQDLRNANVTKRYANALARGKEAPQWRLGTSFMRGNIKRVRLLVDRETSRMLRERRRFLRRESRVLQQPSAAQ